MNKVKMRTVVIPWMGADKTQEIRAELEKRNP